jgi:hypothetical protein
MDAFINQHYLKTHGRLEFCPCIVVFVQQHVFFPRIFFWLLFCWLCESVSVVIPKAARFVRYEN